MEVKLRLHTPSELFSVPTPDFRDADARLRPGIDQIVDELEARWTLPAVRIVVSVPLGASEGWSVADLADAVKRYVALRRRRIDLETRKLRREGVGALRLGLPLFVVGLAVSYFLTRGDDPLIVQVVLGYGVFLVISWIGLWYPLDTLLFSRRPYVRELHALKHVERADFALVEE